MTTDLFLDQKRFISVKRASQETGYTQDYLGQLCRQKKIPAKLVGRSWFVDFEALLSYKKGISSKDETPSQTIEVKNVVNNTDLVLPSTTSSSKQEYKYVSESPVELPRLNKFTQNRKKSLNIPKEQSMLVVAFVVTAFVLGNVFVSASKLLLPEIASSLENRFYLAMSHGAEVTESQDIDDGLVVFPQDESSTERIEDIKNSFSDEVEVLLDEGNSSGVIRPVFRSGKGEDYAFVLVPIKPKQ